MTGPDPTLDPAANRMPPWVTAPAPHQPPPPAAHHPGPVSHRIVTAKGPRAPHHPTHQDPHHPAHQGSHQGPHHPAHHPDHQDPHHPDHHGTDLVPAAFTPRLPGIRGRLIESTRDLRFRTESPPSLQQRIRNAETAAYTIRNDGPWRTANIYYAKTVGRVITNVSYWTAWAFGETLGRALFSVAILIPFVMLLWGLAGHLWGAVFGDPTAIDPVPVPVGDDSVPVPDDPGAGEG
jgi:hypothetical protein